MSAIVGLVMTGEMSPPALAAGMFAVEPVCFWPSLDSKLSAGRDSADRSSSSGILRIRMAILIGIATRVFNALSDRRPALSVSLFLIQGGGAAS